MLKWRLLVEEGRKTGHTFSQPDLIIVETFMPSVSPLNLDDYCSDSSAAQPATIRQSPLGWCA